MTEQTKGTTRPMNTGVLKRVFSVLVVLLIASVLMVGAVSATGEMTITPNSNWANSPLQGDSTNGYYFVFNATTLGDNTSVKFDGWNDNAVFKVNPTLSPFKINGNNDVVSRTVHPIVAINLTGKTSTDEITFDFSGLNLDMTKVVSTNKPAGFNPLDNGVGVFYYGNASLTVENLYVVGNASLGTTGYSSYKNNTGFIGLTDGTLTLDNISATNFRGDGGVGIHLASITEKKGVSASNGGDVTVENIYAVNNGAYGLFAKHLKTLTVTNLEGSNNVVSDADGTNHGGVGIQMHYVNSSTLTNVILHNNSEAGLILKHSGNTSSSAASAGKITLNNVSITYDSSYEPAIAGIGFAVAEAKDYSWVVIGEENFIDAGNKPAFGYTADKEYWGTGYNVATVTHEDGTHVLATGFNNTGVKWTGSNTDGWTLKIESGAEDDYAFEEGEEFTLKKMEIAKEGVTINGRGDSTLITLNAENGETAIEVKSNTENVVLQNFNLTAATDANFATAIKMREGGKLIDSIVDLRNQNAEPSTAGGRQTAVAVRLEGADAVVDNSLLIAGNSATSSSQAIVVAASNATINNATLIAENAKNDYIDSGSHTSSGSVAVRLSKDGASANVTNSFIVDSVYDTTRDSAFAIDGSKISSASLNATNNVIVLNATTNSDVNGGGYGTVVYLNPQTGASDLTVNLTSNFVVGSQYVLYADNETQEQSSFAVKGLIYNNYFGYIEKPVVENYTTVTLTTTDLKWNVTPTAGTPENAFWMVKISGEQINEDTDSASSASLKAALAEENIVLNLPEGQTHTAGNWWAWSNEHKGTATGYATLTEADAKAALGVADCHPLVVISEEELTINIIGNTSVLNVTDADSSTKVTETISAEFSDGSSTDGFVWTFADGQDIITVTGISGNTITGKSITYSGLKIGTTSVTVSATVGTKKVEETFIITVYNTTTPVVGLEDVKNTDGVVTIKPSTDGSTIEVVTGTDATTATIKATDGVNITLTFEGNVQTQTDTTGAVTLVSGKVASVVVTYPESESPVSTEATGAVKYELDITLDADKVLVDGGDLTTLPTIDPQFNETIANKITDKETYVALAMITASMTPATDLDNFDKNISKINLKFVIDADMTGKKFKVIHFGNGEKIDAHAEVVGTQTIITAESPYGFSSYVLVEDTTKPKTDGGGSGSSSSSGSSTWLPSEPTQQPTETPTEQPTTPTDTVPTDIPSTQPTATPASPGFGILAVLAGLGAVAVLRRQ